MNDISKENLQNKIKTALAGIVSELLKINIEDIDESTEFNEYGFDSITFTEYAGKLNDNYKLGVTPTIFYENTTIKSLSAYLEEEYRSQLSKVFSEQSIGGAGEHQSKAKAAHTNVQLKSRRNRFARLLDASSTRPQTGTHEPVAIIGMSGIFPMSRDLDEFRKVLEEGRDCISEIPEDRWDWREFYGDPKKEFNKTNIKWGGFIDGVDG
jgi:polyketide synthase PksN